MEQEGEIIALGAGTAKVRVRRPGGCEHCGACELGANPETVVELPNPNELPLGARVRLVVDEGEVVKAAGLVYVVPLVGLFVGFGAGQWLRSSFGLRSELWTLLCGLVTMGISLVVVYLIDRHGKSKRCLPRMEAAN